jgi:hypothetical protein
VNVSPPSTATDVKETPQSIDRSRRSRARCRAKSAGEI